MDNLQNELRLDLFDLFGIEDLSNSDLEELEAKLQTEDDFEFEIERCEYRFISADSIWDIYYNEQEEQITELFLSEIKKQWWIEIDMEATIDNVFNADGYDHHFGRYDGSGEELIYDGQKFHIYRVNQMKTIIILDFSNGKVIIKDYDTDRKYDDAEDFLTDYGFCLSNCEWMIVDKLILNI